jgi:cell division protein FtsB
LERVARERFGMIREGETLYRFALPEPLDEEEGGS